VKTVLLAELLICRYKVPVEMAPYIAIAVDRVYYKIRKGRPLVNDGSRQYELIEKWAIINKKLMIVKKVSFPIRYISQLNEVGINPGPYAVIRRNNRKQSPIGVGSIY